MSTLAKLLAIAAAPLWPPLLAAECGGAGGSSCGLKQECEETSLLQVEKMVKPGFTRSERERLQDVDVLKVLGKGNTLKAVQQLRALAKGSVSQSRSLEKFLRASARKTISGVKSRRNAGVRVVIDDRPKLNALSKGSTSELLNLKSLEKLRRTSVGNTVSGVSSSRGAQPLIAQGYVPATASMGMPMAYGGVQQIASQ